MADPIEPPALPGKPWLTIIGISEDGAIPPSARAALTEAEAVFGGPRHLALAGVAGTPWPVPFSVAPVLALRGRKVAVLASGDPFWHGAGGALSAGLQRGEWVAYPAPSTFALAAARMGWRLEDVLCLGLHAAPYARLRPLLAPGMRAICLMRDGDAPAGLAAWLTAQGWGATRITTLEALGGPGERLRSARAEGFALTCAAPVAVALEVAGAPGLSRAPGLPDDLFAHDGQITKSPVRALTVAALAPRPGDHLWDVGAGSGSVAIEVLLAAPGATATCIEPRPERADNIRCNAERFGLAQRLSVTEGAAPEALRALPRPDLAFHGGGGRAVLDPLWAALPAGTRLVSNAVTLDSEAALIHHHATHGGRLLRVQISEAAPLGGGHGWHAARPITQWQVTR